MDDDERDEREAEIAENRARIEQLAPAWGVSVGDVPPDAVGRFLHGLGAAVRVHAERAEMDPEALRWMGLYLEFWAGQVGRWADVTDERILAWADGLDPDAARRRPRPTSTSDG